MIQRGQRDVRYFLKKSTLNDPLGDSGTPTVLIRRGGSLGFDAAADNVALRADA